MDNKKYELTDEALENIAGGTVEEYNELVDYLKAHNAYVTDQGSDEANFVESFNRLMRLDPYNSKGQLHVTRIKVLKNNANKYFFALDGVGNLGPSDQGMMLALLKNAFDE